jgi:hypothetical protein
VVVFGRRAVRANHSLNPKQSNHPLFAGWMPILGPQNPLEISRLAQVRSHSSVWTEIDAWKADEAADGVEFESL